MLTDVGNMEIAPKRCFPKCGLGYAGTYIKTLLCWETVDNVTRLGAFSIFLATNFLAKLAQIIGNFCSYSVKPHSCLKNELATFWATFVRKYWPTFYSNMRAHVANRRLQQNIIIQKLIIFKVSTINVSIERLGAQAKIRKKNHCFHMM